MTFLTDLQGQPVTVEGGVTLVRENHELLIRYPQWFTRVDEVLHYEA